MKFVILGYVWPEPESSAAGSRSLTLIDFIQGAGHEVIFASSCRDNAGAELLKSIDVPAVAITSNDSGFDQWIGELKPDVVIFDRFLTEEHFGARVREACPDALRVLDTVDLHFLRRARESALKLGLPFDEICRAAASIFDPLPDDALRELASIYRVDLTLVISRFERKLLVERFGIPTELLMELPLCYEPAQHSWPSFDERSGFVMIGNFRHRPNADAVTWLKKEIWPLIRRALPKASVQIYGAYPPREMTSLSRASEGFFVPGPAPSCLEALSRHRVSLAPLRFGAGQKGKIADSWRAGTPVVTTPIGAEGMELGPRAAGEPADGKAHDGMPASRQAQFGGHIGLTAEELARAAVQLHELRADWEAAALIGRETLAQQFAPAPHRALLLGRIEESVRQLPALRSRNLVGALLAHHQHASTKYFSRWIELKARVQSS